MISDKKIIAWVSIVTLAISAWLLLLTAFGYGRLVLDVPAGATVTINGNPVSDPSKSIRLRSGTYRIGTVSARYFSSYKSVHVSPFLTTHYTPDKQQRSFESIAATADGVSSAGLPPTPSGRWFGDTWVVEEVGFSTPSVLVAHYENGRWIETYKTGDTLDTTKVPPDVVQYVQSSEEAIRASLN